MGAELIITAEAAGETERSGRSRSSMRMAQRTVEEAEALVPSVEL